MLFIGSYLAISFAIEKNDEILRNLFLRLEEFGNIWGTFGALKFVLQKLMPEHFDARHKKLMLFISR